MGINDMLKKSVKKTSTELVDIPPFDFDHSEPNKFAARYQEGAETIVHTSESLTDWARVDAMQDADIDLSDCPEITPDMLQRAVIRRGLQSVPPKSSVTLQVDQDVLAWFQAQGRNYKARLNALLRSYLETHRNVHKSA